MVAILYQQVQMANSVENRVETDATKIADYLQGLQRTVYDASTLINRGTNPISLGISNPTDPLF